MAKTQEPLPFRIFVGERLLEDLTPVERAAFQDQVAERMGLTFNDYFGQHPEVYSNIPETAPPHT